MMPILTVGNTDIPYEVRFSSKAIRKRIVVTPDGVEVVAPKGAAWDGPNGVLSYVERKRRWVFDSVREVEEKHRKFLTNGMHLGPSSSIEEGGCAHSGKTGQSFRFKLDTCSGANWTAVIA